MHCDLRKKNIQVQYYYPDFAASLTITQTVWWDKNEKFCGVCLKTYVVKDKREALKEGRKGLKDLYMSQPKGLLNLQFHQ